MPEAMLNFVCWLYIQAVPVLYFFPWFSVTFWEGAQAMKKSIKHAQLDDIQRCGWVDMGPPFMDHYTACFFPIDAGHVGRKIQSHRESTLPFCFGIQTRKKQNKKNSQQMEVHDWLKYRFVCFVLCFFWFWFQSRKTNCRQHWRNWLCSMILPMKKYNIYFYMYICI